MSLIDHPAGQSPAHFSLYNASYLRVSSGLTTRSSSQSEGFWLSKPHPCLRARLRYCVSDPSLGRMPPHGLTHPALTLRRWPLAPSRPKIPGGEDDGAAAVKPRQESESCIRLSAEILRETLARTLFLRPIDRESGTRSSILRRLQTSSLLAPRECLAALSDRALGVVFLAIHLRLEALGEGRLAQTRYLHRRSSCLATYGVD